VSLSQKLIMNKQSTSHRDVYRKLNQSFKRRYVHNFGRGVGFCSEYIHVLKTVAQCLDNKIQFCLQENRNPRGFAVERGWEDYFEPLFPIVTIPVVGSLNRSMFPANRIPILRGLSRTLLKATSGCEYFIFDTIGDGKITAKNIDELYPSDNYWDNMQFLCNMLWHCNSNTAAELDHLRDDRLHNTPYIAAHIRRGDKITEHDYVPLQAYIAEIRKRAHQFADVYIATDDSRVIQEISKGLEGVIRVHCCESMSDVHGYDQSEFNSSNTESRKHSTIQFMSELILMSNADVMIGTATSNVFCMCRYMRGNKECIGL
jgi:hypothetical protein